MTKVLRTTPHPGNGNPRPLTTGNFDCLANSYCWWEYLIFGTGLQRARLHYLPALRGARNVLLIGDGDGRFLEQLMRYNRQAQCLSIDTSLKMIRRARQRCSPNERKRVNWVHGNVLDYNFAQYTFDAVVTLFVFDLLPPGQRADLLDALLPQTTPHALWLYADFSPTDTLRKQLWIEVLKAFFRLTCAVSATHLDCAIPQLKRQGFELQAHTHFGRQLYGAALLRRGGKNRRDQRMPVTTTTRKMN